MADKQLLLLCSCYSCEHQMIIHLDEGGDFYPPEAYVRVHLIRRSFWYRLKYGIKYIFGHTSVYGEWDELILTHRHAKQLRDMADFLDTKS